MKRRTKHVGGGADYFSRSPRVPKLPGLKSSYRNENTFVTEKSPFAGSSSSLDAHNSRRRGARTESSLVERPPSPRNFFLKLRHRRWRGPFAIGVTQDRGVFNARELICLNLNITGFAKWKQLEIISDICMYVFNGFNCFCKGKQNSLNSFWFIIYIFLTYYIFLRKRIVTLTHMLL